ncbi:YdcF family protein [Marinobacter sp. M-5]|uniref:YdcF family protein n=1 Tax=Marinobacter sp. M-5 TaxID=3081089 RepID=UPI00293C642D|nr:YdcF family protein [Marinobacter sp. M-5]MDV3503100.1 YdcF family protein [Marinobacter sp. M-5]
MPGNAMVLENRSRNTSQNAEFPAEILAEQGVSRVLLVTCAHHTPRATRLLDTHGLEVVPVATDHEVLSRPKWRNLLPETSALDGGSRAIKEVVRRLVGR